MHIELTDHLRCPKDHDEAFLILLPERMDGRRVAAGILACPICSWQASWDSYIPDFGDAWTASANFSLPAEALPPMLGIEGAGGWIALGGSAGRVAGALAALLPGVTIVAVNPPEDIAPDDTVQVIRSGSWPIKSHALRGAVLGADAEQWRDAALASLLPGRHLIGMGEQPTNAEILGEFESVWVAKQR